MPSTTARIRFTLIFAPLLLWQLARNTSRELVCLLTLVYSTFACAKPDKSSAILCHQPQFQ